MEIHIIHISSFFSLILLIKQNPTPPGLFEFQTGCKQFYLSTISDIFLAALNVQYSPLPQAQNPPTISWIFSDLWGFTQLLMLKFAPLYFTQ